MEKAFRNKDKEEVLRQLRGHFDSDLECEDALHRACENGWIDVAKILLDKFLISPDIPDFWKTKLKPIHAAARSGQVEAISFLVLNGAPVDSEDATGNSALHYAMREGHWKTTEELVTRFNANLLKKNIHGSIPLLLGLEYALKHHDNTAFHSLLKMYDSFPSSYTVPYSIVQAMYEKDWIDELIYLMEIDGDKAKVSPSDMHTPLVLTLAENGDKDILKILLKHDADITTVDAHGNTTLLLALDGSHWELAKLILQAAPGLANVVNEHGKGAVRFAARGGNLDTLKFVFEYGADPDVADKDGNTPLLSALREDHRIVAEYLVKDLQCNIGHLNKYGDSPLSTELLSALYEANIERALWLLELDMISSKVHNRLASLPKNALQLACQKNLIPVVEKLLQIYHCDPLEPSKVNGQTPYHNAFKDKNVVIAKLLLAYKACSPQLEAKNGDTLLSIAENDNQLLELLELGQHSSVEFARKPVKIFVVGNPSSGKSALVHSIKMSAGDTKFFSQVGTLTKRKPSIGIKCRKIILKEAGKVIIYDCSGHPQYYNSHAAIIQNLVKSLPAVFIIAVNINQNREDVAKQVTYWADFIKCLCISSSGPSYIIVAGSYADKSSMNLWGFQNCSWVSDSISSIVAGGGAMLDCRKLASHGLTNLLSLISQSCASIKTQVSKLQFEHLALYAHISDQLPMVSCSYLELSHFIARNDVEIYPVEDVKLEVSLQLLNDKGLVLFLKDESDVHRSQIVLQPEIVLLDVLGSVFAPHSYKQHCPLDNTGGNVQIGDILHRFPNLDPKMLRLFFKYYSLCLDLPVDSESQESMLFFPALVMQEHSSNDLAGAMQVPNNGYKFGWLTNLYHEDRFVLFSSRFFHLLQIEVMKMLANVPQSGETLSPEAQPKVEVWRQGIYYSDGDGIHAVIELLENHQYIRLLMSCLNEREMKLVERRSQLIQIVHSVKEKCCSYDGIRSLEYVIAPSELKHYPLQQPSSELCKCKVSTIALAIINGEDTVRFSDNESTDLKLLLYFDAYNGLTSPLLNSLMNPTVDGLSIDFLKRIAECMSATSTDPLIVACHLLVLPMEVITQILAEHGPTSDVIMFEFFKNWSEQLTSPNKVETLNGVLTRFSIFGHKGNSLVRYYC